MTALTEAPVEQALLTGLQALSWEHGPDIAPNTERGDYGMRCYVGWLEVS